MDILQQTLPEFFKTGLVATDYHLPLNVQEIIGGKGPEQGDRGADEEGIYSRSVRLEYTPPMALPSLFPRQVHIDGASLCVPIALPLY